MSKDTPDQPDLERLLSGYQAIREARSTATREYKEKDAAMKHKLGLVEVALMRIMKDTGSDQLKITGIGMAYATEKTFVTAKDWEAVLKYVVKHDRLDFLQRRLSSKAITDFMHENDGVLPPGVDASTERVVIVRRA